MHRGLKCSAASNAARIVMQRGLQCSSACNDAAWPWRVTIEAAEISRGLGYLGGLGGLGGLERLYEVGPRWSSGD